MLMDGHPLARSLRKRSWTSFALFFVLLLTVAPAHARGYLDVAAMLLEDSKRSIELMARRSDDPDLVDALLVLADARLDLAKKAIVPKELYGAHPHLLLALDHAAQAAEAAKAGKPKKMIEHIVASRDEEKVMKTVLTSIGKSLPSPPKEGK